MAAERRTARVVVGTIVAAVLVAIVGVVAFASFHLNEGRALPSFPSLAQHPDPSLKGTVAYYSSGTGCIRIVAASGTASRDVWCLPKESPQQWATVGKPAGPQLVWRPDGRLEVTMFRMKPDANSKTAPPLTAGWQKLIDVGTGKVEDVPASQVPSAPDSSSQQTVSPTGERITWNLDAATGKARVVLTTASGKRTLLSVHGPGEYTYQFGPAFWAPNWQWVAATDDDRILVITRTDPAVTRVLVTGAGGGAGGGTAGPTFAVTGANLVK